MRLAGGAETAEVAFLGEPTANFNGPAIDRPRSSSLHSRLTGRSSAWLERLLWEQEVARSNRVAPTHFRNKPFGQQVEGLSHLRNKTCAVERAVQKSIPRSRCLVL